MTKDLILVKFIYEDKKKIKPGGRTYIDIDEENLYWTAFNSAGRIRPLPISISGSMSIVHVSKLGNYTLIVMKDEHELQVLKFSLDGMLLQIFKINEKKQIESNIIA